MQLAGEGVVLVHRTGVVAELPAQHRHQIGQQPAGLAKGESNGVPAIDQPAPPDPRIMMCSSDVQAEPSQFRCAADKRRRCCATPNPPDRVEVRTGHLVSENLAVPLRRRIGVRRSRVGADSGQIIAGRSSGRQSVLAGSMAHR